MRKLQIGIMGSAADLNYDKEVEDFAKEVGRLVAKSNGILVYGAEKDYSSLSTNAAIAASEAGGLTVGITGGKKKEVFGDFMPDVIIPCGQEIGGGREFTLVLSCDVIIAISGGSGTLNEISVAYQAGIPIVTIPNFGGWAGKLSDDFLDDRKRLLCVGARTPKEAVAKAIELATK